jgi:hypothetical protein
MSGKNLRVNSIELRKELLLAESELNRAQLGRELDELKAGFDSVAHRVKTFGGMASAAGAVVAGLAAFKRGRNAGAATKPSWLQLLLKNAGLISSLWLAFRPRKDKQMTGV